jgi:hypothetical protein
MAMPIPVDVAVHVKFVVFDLVLFSVSEARLVRCHPQVVEGIYTVLYGDSYALSSIFMGH